jgi:hypothetical protein
MPLRIVTKDDQVPLWLIKMLHTLFTEDVEVTQLLITETRTPIPLSVIAIQAMEEQAN